MTTESESGSIEAAVRADVGAMSNLTGVQPSLAQLAYRLAALLDSGAKGMAAASLSRDLRETLVALKEAADAGDATSEFEAFLSTPVGDAETS